VRTADFHFDLPPELIAQAPANERDQSRLLVLRRQTGAIVHQGFSDLLDHLHPGDLLVLNDSKVIPARIHGVKAKTGAEFELLLLEPGAGQSWWAMVRPAKRAPQYATSYQEQHRSAHRHRCDSDGHP
jgi:S-adenosylmethionine:tRNA ribosyltransferase-isomerase